MYVTNLLYCSNQQLLKRQGEIAGGLKIVLLLEVTGFCLVGLGGFYLAKEQFFLLNDT